MISLRPQFPQSDDRQGKANKSEKPDFLGKIWVTWHRHHPAEQKIPGCRRYGSLNLAKFGEAKVSEHDEYEMWAIDPILSSLPSLLTM
jgi:hypothetical protein